MTKALTFDELGMVIGGTISFWRKFEIHLEVATAKEWGLTLKQAQDSIAHNQEERDYIASIW